VFGCDDKKVVELGKFKQSLRLDYALPLVLTSSFLSLFFFDRLNFATALKVNYFFVYFQNWLSRREILMYLGSIVSLFRGRIFRSLAARCTCFLTVIL